MEKLEPLCSAAKNEKWCSHYGEQDGGSSKNLLIESWSSNSTSGHIPWRTESRSSLRGLAVTNQIHEDSGSIPGPAKWVKDRVLSWAVV